jgi:hypothetical protein
VTDQIEAACHNAMRAMHRAAERAHREQRSPETCLILAAGLEALLCEGIDDYEQLRDCRDHLVRPASPLREVA